MGGAAASGPSDLRQCRSCGRTLLKRDFLSRPVAFLDHALAYHSEARCMASPSAVGEDALRGLLPDDESHVAVPPSALSDSALHVRNSAESPMWPNDDPPLLFCARHGLTSLAARLIDGRFSLGDLDATARF